MRSTLIISTYNRPDALNWVLWSVSRQSVLPCAVLVVDDGSGLPTGRCIERWSKVLQCPLVHCWQADRGFRAARARNLALVRVDSEHVIWVDGDCMLPPNFVASHQRLAERARLVAGGRALLDSVATARVLSQSLDPLHESPVDQDRLQGVFRSPKFRRLPLGPLRGLNGKAWHTVRTCNLSMMTEDIRAVGGFDESYEGWGREDSDLVVRMVHAGCRIRSGRFAACVAHLHHPEASRDRLSDNERRFQSVLQNPSRVLPVRSMLLS